MVLPVEYVEVSVAVNALLNFVFRDPLVARQLPFELEILIVLV